MAPSKPHRYEICPHCGADFPAGRLACPECGSDDRTGWKSEAEISYESVEIPDTYDPDVWEKGLGGPTTPRWILVTSYVVIVAFLISISIYGIMALLSQMG